MYGAGTWETRDVTVSVRYDGEDRCDHVDDGELIPK